MSTSATESSSAALPKPRRKQHHVVISGTAGVFPDCPNVQEFQDRLFRGINLVKPQTITVFDHTIHLGTGSLPDFGNLDSYFFHVTRKVADMMDPLYRVILPISFAAISDSGLNPGELANRMVGVIGSAGVSEYEGQIFHPSFHTVKASNLMGVERAIMSNRIAFLLDVKGPSFSIYSDGTGMIDAIVYAKELIERGAIESAVVVGANLLRHPLSPFHDHFMGVLNEDGCTKCFSDDADGYSQSEAGVAFFLQREEDALRSYGRILGVRNSYMGDKTVGRINQIPRNLYSGILQDFYSANEIDPSTIAYVEAAGIALKTGDAEELNALTEVLLGGDRRSPLLVGSVKSVAGHAGGCADGLALLKAILVANAGLIPKNINFTKPNSLVPALLDGRMKVVTKTTPLEGDRIAVNAMDGSKTLKHLVLERSPKTKKYVPEKPGVLPPDGLPRLFLMTGRNEKATLKAISEVEGMPIDPDFIGLSHRLFSKGIRKHTVRAFTVLNDKDLKRSEIWEHFTGSQPPPLWFVYSGVGSQWPGMGTDLMKLPTFAQAIHSCQEILKRKGLDLIEIITSPDPKTFDSPLNSFVGIAAVQIGLTDLLREVGLVPDGMIGHSVGELGCAYADGCLTAEQMMLAAYARGKACLEADLIPGMMAAVGKGYQEMKKNLPKELDIACHNGATSCTLSGPTEALGRFVKELTSKGVFAKLVSSGGMAYHSRYIRPAAPPLLEALKEVIPRSPLRRRRSKKWISSSVPAAQWDSQLAQCCSPEYLTNNLLSPVLFEEAGSAHIPQHAVIVEVSPHGLLQAILRQSFPSAHHIPLTKRGDSDGVVFFLTALGKLYNRGYPVLVERLYPPVEFPVPRGTPSLGGFLNWEPETHETFLSLITNMEEDKNVIMGGVASLELGKLESLKEFIFNGTALLPISAFIKVACDKRVEQAANQGKVLEFLEMKNLKLNSFLNGEKDVDFELSTSFAAFHGTETVFRTDFVELSDNETPVWTEPSQRSAGEEEKEELCHHHHSPQDFYLHLSDLGLQLGPSLRLIQEFRKNKHGVLAEICWNGDLLGFLENVLLLPVFALGSVKSLFLVTNIRELTIDLNKFSAGTNEVVKVAFDMTTNSIVCPGLNISNPVLSDSGFTEYRRCRFYNVQFLPFQQSGEQDISSFLSHVREIVLNSLILDSINGLDIYEIEPKSEMHQHVMEVFKNTLGIPVQVKLYDEDVDLPDVKKNQMEKGNYLFILNRSDQMKNTLEYLKYTNQGFILLLNSNVPSSLGIVASSRIGNNLFSLCTLARRPDEAVPFIYTSSKDWEFELQTALDSPANRVVYLVDGSKVFQVEAVTEMCRQFYKHQKIRFIFHDEAEFKPHLHMEHLQKDLKINVLHEGKWGTPRVTELCLESVSPLLERTPAFRFSQLKLEGTEIVALGLPKNDHNKNNKFDVVEYSGVEASGREVCGLGSVTKTASIRTITPDSILRWDKPQDWSHEEISAVLLPYTLAYYMLKIYSWEDITRTTEKVVLVHRGSLPISQAVITVALIEKFDVYITYLGESERCFINSHFPQIPMENIVSCETSQYSEVLMEKLRARGQKGFTLVVNSLEAEVSLVPSLNLLQRNGRFFQCTDVENSDKHLGMSIFKLPATVFGVFPSLLWELGVDVKEMLRDSVKNALSSGRIKPLYYKEHSMNLANLEAIELLNGNDLSDTRLIVTRRGLPAVDTTTCYIAEENATYVFIVGQTVCWLPVLEWLTLRGANRIILLIDLNQQINIVLHKLNTLIKENPQVTYLIESRKRNLKNVLNGDKIAAIFVLGDEDPTQLQDVLEKAGNAKIFYFAKKLSIYLGNNAKSSLQIIDKNDCLNSYALSSHLDKLLMAEDSVLYSASSNESGTSETVDDWSPLGYGQHLPVSVSEVLALARTRRAPHWKEIRTNTSRYECCREVQPLFFIPSLKEGSFKELYAGLFHPAFEAVIPRNASLEEIAQSLLKELLRYESEVFSLVSSDWGCELALRLSRLLEENHKTVSLIVFDGSFNWKSKELFAFTERKVAMQLTESPLSKNKERLMQTGLEVLKERLHLVSADESTPLSPVTTSGLQQRLSAFVILIRNNLSTDHLFKRLQETVSEADDQLIVTLGSVIVARVSSGPPSLPERERYSQLIFTAEYCEECGGPVEVVSTEESSFLDMLTSKTVADTISRAVLVDRISSARPPSQRRYSLTRVFKATTTLPLNTNHSDVSDL